MVKSQSRAVAALQAAEQAASCGPAHSGGGSGSPAPPGGSRRRQQYQERQRQQISELQRVLDSKADEFAVHAAENDRLRQKLRVLETVLPASEQHLASLSYSQDSASTPWELMEHLFIFEGGQGQNGGAQRGAGAAHCASSSTAAVPSSSSSGSRCSASTASAPDLFDSWSAAGGASGNLQPRNALAGGGATGPGKALGRGHWADSVATRLLVMGAGEGGGGAWNGGIEGGSSRVVPPCATMRLCLPHGVPHTWGQ